MQYMYKYTKYKIHIKLPIAWLYSKQVCAITEQVTSNHRMKILPSKLYPIDMFHRITLGSKYLAVVHAFNCSY